MQTGSSGRIFSCRGTSPPRSQICSHIFCIRVFSPSAMPWFTRGCWIKRTVIQLYSDFFNLPTFEPITNAAKYRSIISLSLLCRACVSSGFAFTVLRACLRLLKSPNSSCTRRKLVDLLIYLWQTTANHTLAKYSIYVYDTCWLNVWDTCVCGGLWLISSLCARQ